MCDGYILSSMFHMYEAEVDLLPDDSKSIGLRGLGPKLTLAIDPTTQYYLMYDQFTHEQSLYFTGMV